MFRKHTFLSIFKREQVHVKEYLKNINSCELLYAYNDPKGAVGDQDPKLEKGVLYYQPIGYKFETKNLPFLLLQVSNNLDSLRRSNTLKFYFGEHSI